MQCPRCRASVQATDLFCPRCGLTRDEAAAYDPTRHPERTQVTPAASRERTAEIPWYVPASGASGARTTPTEPPPGQQPPDDRPHRQEPPAEPPPSRKGAGSWLIALLALVVLGVGIGAVALTWPWGGDDGSSSQRPDSDGRPSPTQRQDSSPPPTASPTDSPQPTGATQATQATPTGGSSSTVGQSTSVPPPTASPTAPPTQSDAQIADEYVSSNVSAINNLDYAAWKRLVSSSYSSEQPESDWVAGHDTTRISSYQVMSSERNGDQVMVWFRMRSTQAPEDGPDGQSCTVWSLDYTLEQHGRRWILVDHEPHGMSAGYSPC